MLKLNKLKKSMSKRVVIVTGAFLFAYFILLCRLFSLQVVNGQDYNVQFKESILRNTTITAPRGTIYDKYGVPLATTKVVYNLKYNKSDTSISMEESELNDMFIKIIKILQENDREVNDEMPISEERPYKFLYTSETRIKNWEKNDLGFKEDEITMDAEEVMAKLYDKFCIEYPDETEEIRRKLCAIRYGIYVKRYYGYIPLDLASDVDTNIVIAIEERRDEFPRIEIESEPVRYYTMGKAFTHILGYVGTINETEYEEMKDKGYKTNSIIGKVGIESEFEEYLKGEDGNKVVEVDNMGRTMTSTVTVEPQPGNNIYLNIDSVLQQNVYDTLEKQLNEGLINRLNGAVAGYGLSTTTAYNALAAGDAINLSTVMKAKSGVQLTLQNKILNAIGEEETYRQCFKRLASIGVISPREMLLTLIEQGRITDQRIINEIKGGAGLSQILVDSLRARQINAEDLRIDPCTGSVVILDVNTGKTLALVNYPSYDANRLVGNFDTRYYSELLNNPCTPMLNRALAQRKAPGSVFKIITAIAGLETGTITKYSQIYDKGIYTEAGLPAAKCWKYPGSHGSINVVKALEVSCNYFFYSLSMRLGQTASSSSVGLKGVNVISKYAEMFGLSELSGIELEDMEYKPEISNPVNKEKQVKLYNKNATIYDTRWYDGDTIRTAIGQAYNIFAPIHIAKYIATVANDGTRYTPYLVNRIDLKDGKQIIKEPNVEVKLDIAQSTFDTVKEGMYAVTSGPSGTARAAFSSSIVKVAGKTGTAQETGKPDFGWFGGFAPYDDPQIAVCVMIPYATNTSYSTLVARDVINDYFNINYSGDSLYKDNLLTK
ncbi:MAG: hypothetical protein MJ245_00965 [Clostridia bacterium]|nr:hypothetical protein [Clostridia bacterium]